MNRTVLGRMPLGSNPFAGLAPRIHRGLFILFLLQFVLVWARQWLPERLFPHAHWPEALLLVLATATLLASLARQLPAQNVILASVIVVLIAGAVQTLGALTGIPFGPFAYTPNLGPELFHPLPWPVPLVWLAAILASRGVARLILRPWRNTDTYGFRLIALTVALAVLMDVGLEPLATQVQRYWIWQPTKLEIDWYTAPGTNFLGWGITVFLILAIATPSLINKHPGLRSAKPDYSPLSIWLLFTLLFATGAAVHHLWLACSLVTLSSLVVGVLAVRGARW